MEVVVQLNQYQYMTLEEVIQRTSVQNMGFIFVKINLLRNTYEHFKSHFYQGLPTARASNRDKIENFRMPKKI